MSQHDCDVINYMDDVIGINLPSNIHSSFTPLQVILQHLGFKLRQKKIVPPTTKLSCLGIVVDTTTFTTSIPEDKLQDMCLKWAYKSKTTKHELESLLGSLPYVSLCLKMKILLK